MTAPARSRAAVVVDFHEGEVANKRKAVLGKVFPRGVKLPQALSGKNIIHLPSVKTRVFTTTTGVIKNVFGGLPGCNHPWYPMVGRKRVKQALQSEWGKLFQSY